MLDSLPAEILINAILFLEPLSIRRCQRLCRKLADIIKTSPHVQFILELDSMNYSEPMQPRKDLSYAEKIKVLREHNHRLSNLDLAQAKIVDIKGNHPVIALNNSPELFVFAPGDRWYLSANSLSCMQLVSRNRGTAFDTWTLDNLGVRFSHAIADLESELLILFERPPDEDFVKAHLRCVRSGGNHPAALHPVLAATTKPSDVWGFGIKAQLVGRVLAMIINLNQHEAHLVIWDWTSGAQLANTYLEDEQFLFATESEFATTRDAHLSTSTIGAIDFYAYSDPTLSDGAQSTKRIASFDLPLQNDVESCMVTCHHCPHISKSTFSSRNKIFDIAPNQQWLQLSLQTYTRHHISVDHIVLFVSFGALIDMVRSTSADVGSTRFLWDSWAEHTAWIPLPDIFYYFSGCVYGSRAAYLINEKSGLDVTLNILDFSPRATNKVDQDDIGPIHTKAGSVAQLALEGSRRPIAIGIIDIKNKIFGLRDDEEVPETYPKVTMNEDNLVIHVNSITALNLKKAMYVYDL